MAYDDTKSNFETRTDVPAAEKLTATEYNALVTQTKEPILEQRGDPTTSDLADGEVMLFNSDGSGTGAAGDLVYAVNDAGTVKTAILQALSGATV